MMERVLLFVSVRCFVAAAMLAWFAPFHPTPTGAQEKGCEMPALTGADETAKERWIVCNEELVKGQLRNRLPDWINPGTEWRNVSAHKAPAEDIPGWPSETRRSQWSVCGEVRQKDGLGRFGQFQRFISQGDEGLMLVENLFAEQDNYLWWRKIPYDQLWARYCE